MKALHEIHKPHRSNLKEAAEKGSQMRNRLQTNIQCRGTVVSVLTLESLAPERYNKNSYSLRLKPTGGCLSLCHGILNRNLFIRYAINKLRPVQSQKRKQTCRMTSLLQKELDV